MKNFGKDSGGRRLYSKKTNLELSFVILLIIASVLIPSLKAELFPYSSFALFTDAPKLYVEYEITDNKGHVISPRLVALHRNYYGISPREPYARVKPFSYDKFGHILDKEVIEEAIHKKITIQAPFHYPIKVKQRVFEWTKQGVKNTRTIVHLIEDRHD